jgi:hypothetical protein
MKNLLKIIKLIGLSLLIVFASFGMIVIPIFPNYRERYMHNEIRTELVEKKENENDAQQPDLK